MVDAPIGNGETASLSAVVNSAGKITSITVNSGGSGYDPSNPPKVSIVGGPHLVKICDVSSPNYGRVFLITDNNRSRLNLDDARLETGETIESVFTAGTTIEVVRAPTLGTIFGIDTADLPTNWTWGFDEFSTSTATDWIYLQTVLATRDTTFFMWMPMSQVPVQ